MSNEVMIYFLFSCSRDMDASRRYSFLTTPGYSVSDTKTTYLSCHNDDKSASVYFTANEGEHDSQGQTDSFEPLSNSEDSIISISDDSSNSLSANISVSSFGLEGVEVVQVKEATDESSLSLDSFGQKEQECGDESKQKIVFNDTLEEMDYFLQYGSMNTPVINKDCADDAAESNENRSFSITEEGHCDVTGSGNVEVAQSVEPLVFLQPERKTKKVTPNFKHVKSTIAEYIKQSPSVFKVPKPKYPARHQIGNHNSLFACLLIFI